MGHAILDLIGNTPVVEIKHLNPNPKVKIFAKLEYMNPGGSIKDRAALFMIEEGERSGELTPNKTVIEATSGNTGIGLALVCAVKGYKLLLAMSEYASIERQKILKARGADILLTPGRLGTDGAIEEVYRMAREHPDAYFLTDQFNNDANWKAHYYGTAKEIWDQTDGKLASVVVTMGTTGTLMGIARHMNELHPHVRVIGVEPYLGHKIQGLKNMKESYCPEIYDKSIMSQKVHVDDEDAFEMARRLARQEGIFVGMSSGAAMVAAINEATSIKDGTIVVILPDGGERYLSTSLFTVQEKIDLKLFNTATRRKEAFVPLQPGKVGMYSCGPTVDSRLRAGEYRRFVFADLLQRYLEYRNYEVRHVINITDLDDKTIAGSEKAGMSLEDFTGQHLKSFFSDLALLNIKSAYKYPRAGEHIQDMLDLAEKLLDKGYAYEKLRSLYFDISGFASYGKLSGIDLDKIRIGATVDLDEYEKQNPRDFTLFKRSKLSELKRGIFVKSKWGNVLPSWHIQSVAMSMKYLGENFDIYTSSKELLFPHNENETAIAGAVTGKPLARYWIHCDRVIPPVSETASQMGDPSLEDLIRQGYSGRQIRYWLMSNHYGKPIKFSRSQLDFSAHSLKRIDACVEQLMEIRDSAESSQKQVSEITVSETDQIRYDIRQGFTQAMDDDINISAAMASLFKTIKKINVLCMENKISAPAAGKMVNTFENIDAVLKIFKFRFPKTDPEIQQLLEKREKARMEKNWKLADQIRDQIQQRGIQIRDCKTE